jgi:hypothetical protein
MAAPEVLTEEFTGPTPATVERRYTEWLSLNAAHVQILKVHDIKRFEAKYGAPRPLQKLEIPDQYSMLVEYERKSKRKL